MHQRSRKVMVQDQVVHYHYEISNQVEREAEAESPQRQTMLSLLHIEVCTDLFQRQIPSQVGGHPRVEKLMVVRQITLA